VDGWRRREIGISGGGSVRRSRLTQGCSAEKKKKKKKKKRKKKKKKKKKKILYFLNLYKTKKL
jgi:uncharacterized Fe-S cluster-containing protein